MDGVERRIRKGSFPLPGGPVPQTPWDLSHAGLPAGSSHAQRPRSAKIDPRARRETNEATLRELMDAEQRQGSLAAPRACRISTGLGAQVASPQSPILRAGNSKHRPETATTQGKQPNPGTERSLATLNSCPKDGVHRPRQGVSVSPTPSMPAVESSDILSAEPIKGGWHEEGQEAES